VDGNQVSNSDDRIGRICRIDNGSGQGSEHGLDSGQWWISDFTKLENIRSSFYYSLLSGVIVDDKNVQVFHVFLSNEPCPRVSADLRAASEVYCVGNVHVAIIMQRKTSVFC